MTRARGSYRDRSQKSAYVGAHGGPDVTLEGVTLGKETDKAILVCREGEPDMWMPLSQVTSMHRGKDKGTDKIVVSGWIAKQKGLQ